MFPSALPARRETSYNAWVTIQIGCDNNCAFCIVPAVRGVEISRPYGDIVAEVSHLAADGVTEVTLLGQNVNSYGRDLQLAARQAGDETARLRPLFADLLARRRGGRRDPTGPVHEPAPEGHASGDLCRDGRVTRDVRAPPLPAAVGKRPRAGAMHRGYTAERYLEKLAEARRTVADLAVSTDIIVGFPGETETDFERTLEVAAEAEYDYAYTFICSAPARGPRRRPCRPTSSTRPWPASASSACVSSSSAPRCVARGTRRSHRGGPGRGPEQAGSVGDQRSDPAEQAGALHAAPAAAHGELRHGRDHPRRPALPRRRTSSSSSPNRPTSCAFPSPHSDDRRSGSDPNRDRGGFGRPVASA